MVIFMYLMNLEGTLQEQELNNYNNSPTLVPIQLLSDGVLGDAFMGQLLKSVILFAIHHFIT